jgi:hypothetical protein
MYKKIQMKKLIKGSIVLLVFASSIMIFQISCQRDVVAQTTTSQLNKIVYDKYFGSPGEVYEIWTSNYDGSNQQKINITMPSGYRIGSQGNARLSPNGEYVFFQAFLINNPGNSYIMKCKTSGGTASIVVLQDPNAHISMGSAN